MRWLGLSALIYAALAMPAAAVETLDPVEATVRYEFSWGGVTFGKIALEADETDATYAMRTLIKSKGLAAVFVKHTSDTKVKGTKSGATYFPQHYEADFDTRGKKKHIELIYDGAGNISQEISKPEDTDRPKPTADELTSAHDPLSLVFDIRRKLYDALANSEKTFKLKMYDGRRLTQVQVDIVDYTQREMSIGNKKLIHVIATRSPIAGYTEKELEGIKSGPNSMHIYFSDDAQLWPMLVEVEVYFATMRGEFVQACAKIEDCF